MTHEVAPCPVMIASKTDNMFTQLSRDRQRWLPILKREYGGLRERKVWSVVPIPKDKQVKLHTYVCLPSTKYDTDRTKLYVTPVYDCTEMYLVSMLHLIPGSACFQPSKLFCPVCIFVFASMQDSHEARTLTKSLWSCLQEDFY